MKTKYLLFLTNILIFSACVLHKEYMPGNTVLLGIHDTLINDSSIIEGYIYSMDPLIHYSYSPGDFIIHIDHTYYQTVNDTQGHYYFKIPPGTYSVQCKSSTSDMIKEEIYNIDVGPNQTAIVYFYMGFIVE